jgi:hypothetical protein
MKDLRRQARVTAFLRKSLAKAPQDVLMLEAMARTEGLLGENQRITHAKPFKRGKHSLRIRSVRAGFGPNGGWRWEFLMRRALVGRWANERLTRVGGASSIASRFFPGELFRSVRLSRRKIGHSANGIGILMLFGCKRHARSKS